jgi:hypothetical protein
MKAGVEQAFVAGELLARTGRYLVVLTLPLVCWLAGQEYPAQALFAWAVRRGTALLATRRTVARVRVSFDTTTFSGDALDEISRIQTR